MNGWQPNEKTQTHTNPSISFDCNTPKPKHIHDSSVSTRATQRTNANSLSALAYVHLHDVYVIYEQTHFVNAVAIYAPTPTKTSKEPTDTDKHRLSGAFGDLLRRVAAVRRARTPLYSAAAAAAHVEKMCDLSVW